MLGKKSKSAKGAKAVTGGEKKGAGVAGVRSRLAMWWGRVLAPKPGNDAKLGKNAEHGLVVVDEWRNNRGLSRVLNMPTMGRVLLVLVIVMAILGMVQAGIGCASVTTNHMVLGAVQASDAFGAVPVQSIEDANMVGEAGDKVTTIYGDTATIMQVFPGIHSDGSSAGLGYWYAQENALIRPVRFDEVWDGAGVAVAFPTLIWVFLVAVSLLSAKGFLSGGKYDIRVNKIVVAALVLVGLAVAAGWVLLMSPLVM